MLFYLVRGFAEGNFLTRDRDVDLLEMINELNLLLRISQNLRLTHYDQAK